MEWLVKLGVPFFKVPSGEISNLPLLAHIGTLGKPVILSTGMADVEEIREALESIGTKNRHNVVLLHCLSDYPGRWEDANLKAMNTIADEFRLPVGFSDHTEGIEISLVAVGMGARVIEKHITLDRSMVGGDHKASLEPTKFKELVTKLRRLEEALGNGIKRCMPSETNVKDVARKSIVAKMDIQSGESIEREMLTMKRPGTGLKPKYVDRIVGRVAMRTITSDEQIQWDDVRG